MQVDIILLCWDIQTHPIKKIVNNNSSKKLTSDQEKLLELGLNFAITPKKFPLFEYIAVT